MKSHDNYFKIFFIFFTILINFSLCYIAEAKTTIKLPDYNITLKSNDSKYPNLSYEYFSCQYNSTRNSSSRPTVRVVFEEGDIHISSIPYDDDDYNVISSSELDTVITFDDSYSLISPGIYEIGNVFKDIMYDETKYLRDHFTEEIKNAKLQISSFGKNRTTICPSYFNISYDGNKYIFDISDEKKGDYSLPNAGKTKMEEELDTCVKNGDCTVPDKNTSGSTGSSSSTNSDGSKTITCPYSYKYDGASYCAIFDFKIKDNKVTNLTITDAVAIHENGGMLKYTSDEAVYNSALISAYIKPNLECYDILYMYYAGGTQSIWVNPENKETAEGNKAELSTLKLSETSTCNDVDKNVNSSNKKDENYDMDLSGCIIDAGTQEIIDWIMNIIRVGGILLLIVLGMLDFIKAAASGEQEEMKKSKSKFIKRLIACVGLFLIPLVVDILLGLINLAGGANGDCSSKTVTEIKEESEA